MLALYASYGFADANTADLVDMTNEVYHDICGLEPWPFLEKQIDLTFDGTTGIPTNSPSDFRALISLNDIASGIKLDPMRVEEHYRKHSWNLTLQGSPIVYFFVPNKTLNVYPIPSASTTVNNLKLTYLKDEPDLTATSVSNDIVIPSKYHFAIVYGVLSMLYLEEDDEAQSDYFLNRSDRKIDRMRRDLWTRNFDKSDTIEFMDDDSGDFYGGGEGADFGAYGP